MSRHIICKTNGPLEHMLPRISYVENPMTNEMGFVLNNFDIEEPVDAYTPTELIAIKNAIDEAINIYCKPSDVKGQMFLWDFDSPDLTLPKNEV